MSCCKSIESLEFTLMSRPRHVPRSRWSWWGIWYICQRLYLCFYHIDLFYICSDKSVLCLMQNMEQDWSFYWWTDMLLFCFYFVCYLILGEKICKYL